MFRGAVEATGNAGYSVAPVCIALLDRASSVRNASHGRFSDVDWDGSWPWRARVWGCRCARAQVLMPREVSLARALRAEPVIAECKKGVQRRAGCEGRGRLRVPLQGERRPYLGSLAASSTRTFGAAPQKWRWPCEVRPGASSPKSSRSRAAFGCRRNDRSG